MLRKVKACLESFGYFLHEIECVKFSNGVEIKDCLEIDSKIYIMVFSDGAIGIIGTNGVIKSIIPNNSFYLMAFNLGWTLKNMNI